MSQAQGTDLNQQAEKEEDKTPSRGLSKTFTDSWRSAAEDTQTPHLPLIYCIFDSEHSIESRPGCPEALHLRAGLGRAGVLGAVMD